MGTIAEGVPQPNVQANQQAETIRFAHAGGEVREANSAQVRKVCEFLRNLPEDQADIMIKFVSEGQDMIESKDSVETRNSIADNEPAKPKPVYKKIDRSKKAETPSKAAEISLENNTETVAAKIVESIPQAAEQPEKLHPESKPSQIVEPQVIHSQKSVERPVQERIAEVFIAPAIQSENIAKVMSTLEHQESVIMSDSVVEFSEAAMPEAFVTPETAASLISAELPVTQVPEPLIELGIDTAEDIPDLMNESVESDAAEEQLVTDLQEIQPDVIVEFASEFGQNESTSAEITEDISTEIQDAEIIIETPQMSAIQPETDITEQAPIESDLAGIAEITQVTTESLVESLVSFVENIRFETSEQTGKMVESFEEMTTAEKVAVEPFIERINEAVQEIVLAVTENGKIPPESVEQLVDQYQQIFETLAIDVPEKVIRNMISELIETIIDRSKVLSAKELLKLNQAGTYEHLLQQWLGSIRTKLPTHSRLGRYVLQTSLAA